MIPDWKPHWFTKEEVVVPEFLPDNELVRDDLARFYTAVNRMDQGVGLILKELEDAGRVDDTLIFFSDNGIPFPSGKTNLYTTQGQGEPFIMVNPRLDAPAARSQVVSSLDFVPTILDAAKIEYPTHAKIRASASVVDRNLFNFLPGGQLETCFCVAPVSFPVLLLSDEECNNWVASPGAKLEL